MEECKRCHGSGYVIVSEKRKESIEVYGKIKELVYTAPCPICNGGEEKHLFEIKSRANLPSTYYDAMLEDFKWDCYLDNNNKIIDLEKHKAFVDSFVENYKKWEQKGLGLYIHSQTRGTGKTFLASCICNTLMEQEHIVTKFVNANELVDLSYRELRQGEKNPIDVMCECRLLVLDDLGQKSTARDYMNDLLFKIIENRYQKKLVTLFTSNLKATDLAIDERVISRISKMTQNIPLPDYSYRQKESFDEKKDFFKEMGLM